MYVEINNDVCICGNAFIETKTLNLHENSFFHVLYVPNIFARLLNAIAVKKFCQYLPAVNDNIYYDWLVR